MTSDEEHGTAEKLKSAYWLSRAAYREVDSIPASDVTPEIGEIHRDLQRAAAYSRDECVRAAKQLILDAMEEVK